VINVGKVLIGNEIELPKFDLLRCKMELTEKTAGNKLSLDVLSGRQILFDFKNQTIVFAPQPGLKSKNLIKLQKRGHLAMAVKIEKKSSFGVWDTGAGLTLVNSEFVKRNPKLFKFIQSVDKGTDGTGKPIQMQLYQMKDLKIGSKSFPNTFVVGMDFMPMREVFNDDVDFVLGFNVISKANWYLDLNSNTWDIAN
jgi:hypothetical protein